MRTVCLVTSTRADFSKTEVLLQRLLSDERFQVQLVVSGSHLLIEGGYSFREIKARYPECKEIHSIVAGDSVHSMSESVAFGMSNFNAVFATQKPDIVIIHGDRFDALSAALASSLQQIFTVHIEGGELSGTVDGSLRHAITKLCHLHFVSTEEARKRVIQLGENPNSVHISGCPSYDRYKTLVPTDVLSRFSLIEHNYYIVMHHPNTEDLNKTLSEYEMLLETILVLDTPCIFFYPNIDPGNKAMIQLFHRYQKEHASALSERMTVLTNIPFDDFATLLRSAKFAMGNSSAIVREACFFGTPSILVGDRQRGRSLAPNTISYNGNCVREMLDRISSHARIRYKPCYMYGDGRASQIIADTLHQVDLNLVKEFYER
ncbi:hypothetical protein M9434_004896 [Picochlorum sp. BPE23]|nr:hypothetical protein M9434_004886 [Picochlorum sp. BPE23]KAI8111324.1 hypothetical protein M9434_004896 [Picochlorum sp. BPE23]